MSEHPGKPCRRCGETIYWHKSKSGKNYPSNSADDRRDFHDCPGRRHTAPAPAPATVERRPVQIETTTEERIQALEEQVSQLHRMFKELRQGVPIGDSDVPWWKT